MEIPELYIFNQKKKRYQNQFFLHNQGLKEKDIWFTVKILLLLFSRNSLSDPNPKPLFGSAHADQSAAGDNFRTFLLGFIKE